MMYLIKGGLFVAGLAVGFAAGVLIYNSKLEKARTAYINEINAQKENYAAKIEWLNKKIKLNQEQVKNYEQNIIENKEQTNELQNQLQYIRKYSTMPVEQKIIESRAIAQQQLDKLRDLQRTTRSSRDSSREGDHPAGASGNVE